MHIPELSPRTYAPELHTGVIVRSVGWLGRRVPHKGHAAPSILEALRRYATTGYRDDNDLGFHTCEICGRANSHGEFWVEWRGVRYVLPMMVFHYVEAHRYLPPDEFLSAVQQKNEFETAGRA
ncbi:MAG: hypothetical protein JWO31_1124 [Phycisphaerales bacterium]|nr:hypothetical protein [Phycisphaerales bacterium]